METCKGEDDNDDYEDDRSENGNVDLLPDLGKGETSKGEDDNEKMTVTIIMLTCSLISAKWKHLSPGFTPSHN